MPDPKPPRHLVGVWNPSYGADVMESHIMLLRERAQRFREGREEEENVYVWWGRIRSSRRQEALPHIADVLALEEELGEGDGDAEREMQLYLTDYRSLYVAHVGEITSMIHVRMTTRRTFHQSTSASKSTVTAGFAFGTSAVWCLTTHLP